ncbi:MAG: M48 family metalloprotease [Frankia sp.]
MVAFLVVGYATILTTLFPRLVRGAAWTRRAPRLAAGIWLAATFSALAAMVLAGLLLIVPILTVGHLLLAIVQECGIWSSPLPAPYPPGATEMIGFGVLVILLVRTGYGAATVVTSQHRRRRAHWSALHLVARRDPTLDIHVIDHPDPAAYCLPGPNGGRIVLSEGAIRRLNQSQLTAVIAHERAHLRGRHHLMTTAAAVLARAFPRLPLFSQSCQELACLMEMAADDAATATSEPHTVAGALLDLADSNPPTAALSMSGPSAADRARRMLGPRARISRPARYLGAAAVAVLLIGPIATPVIPAVLDHSQHCPPHDPTSIRHYPPASAEGPTGPLTRTSGH